MRGPGPSPGGGPVTVVERAMAMIMEAARGRRLQPEGFHELPRLNETRLQMPNRLNEPLAQRQRWIDCLQAAQEGNGAKAGLRRGGNQFLLGLKGPEDGALRNASG